MKADHQLGNIQDVSKFYAAAKSGTLPAVSWVVPSGEVSEHPPAPVSFGQSYVTSLINAVMNEPGLELDGDLPGLGRLGRLLRPRRAADRRSERLRAPGAGHRRSARTPSRATSTTRP